MRALAPTQPYQFNLASEWHLSAVPAAVYALLEDPLRWPTWWPYVRGVAPLQGERHYCFDWKTRLPYRLELELRTVISEPPWLMVAQSRGDLLGIGRWELDEIPLGTRVRYHWQVELDKPWLRALAPLLAPLFAWNHHAVMRAGAEGMARQLEVTLFDYWRRD